MDIQIQPNMNRKKLGYEYLITSDLQFGFKSGVGCADTIYIMRGAIKIFESEQFFSCYFSPGHI